MKVKKHSGSKHLKLAVAAAIADLILNSTSAHAQALSGSTLTVTGSTTLQGNVSVTGTGSVVDFYGDRLNVGTVTSGTQQGQQGVSALYTDGTTSSFSLVATRPFHQWLWEAPTTSGTTVPMMTLDKINGLTVYDAFGHSLVINPSTTGSNSLLTEGEANGLYVSNTVLSAGTCSGYGNGGGGLITGPTLALAGGTATGPWCFAGLEATARGVASTASGYMSQANGNYTVASGVGARVSGTGSTASGYYSVASGMCSTASGAWSRASGTWNSTASATAANASGENSTASAFGATASGYSSTASGYCSNACARYSTASGVYSNATANASTASGYWSTACGGGATASGFLSTASGLYSTAAGNFSTAQGVGQFVVGQFNIPQGNPTVWSGTDDLFTVGNGSGYGNWSQNPTTYGPLFQAIATNPSNAFVVKKNGDTIVSGGLIVSGTTGYPTTIANSGLIVTGSAVTSGTITTIVATPSNLILIPQQGDLSMGTFVAGALPQSPAAQP